MDVFANALVEHAAFVRNVYFFFVDVPPLIIRFRIFDILGLSHVLLKHNVNIYALEERMRVQNLVALACTRSSRVELEPLAPTRDVILRLMVTVRHRLADVSVHTLAQVMHVHCFEFAPIWLNLVLVVRTFHGRV